MMPSPVLIFRRQSLGRMLVLLHQAEIGEIIWHAGRSPHLYPWSWLLRLPSSRSAAWRRARSDMEAFRAIEDEVNDWLRMAGVLDPGAGARCVQPEEAQA
jgi:hypothetical protein